MEVKHVEGANKGKVFVYALSTCGWCKKVKAFLNEEGIGYDYVDVDLIESQMEMEKVVKEEVAKWNPKCSFPTVVINDSVCVVGFDPEKIKAALGI